jgi:hypothetical protein
LETFVFGEIGWAVQTFDNLERVYCHKNLTNVRVHSVRLYTNLQLVKKYFLGEIFMIRKVVRLTCCPFRHDCLQTDARKMEAYIVNLVVVARTKFHRHARCNVRTSTQKCVQANTVWRRPVYTNNTPQRLVHRWPLLQA